MGVSPDDWNQSMSEEWLPVANYEGYYEVSNLGRVRSLDREVSVRGGGLRLAKGKVLKPTMVKGYIKYTLQKEHKPKIMFGHRVVATAFIANPDNKPFINHIDCTKDNNKYTNLEWVTALENIRHSAAKGHYSGLLNHNFARVWNLAKIQQAKKLRHAGASTTKIAEELGVNVWTVKKLHKKEIYATV
jgi:NUMOD4 motif/HNH endonuclease